jgi:hypothetical protein
MDTAVQLTRASTGGYGVASMFSDEDFDVRKGFVQLVYYKRYQVEI